jgi:F-type H+-transporting ATPase subunit alpha
VAEQIASLMAVTGGILDDVAVDDIASAETKVREAMTARLTDLCERIYQGDKLSLDDFNTMLNTAKDAVGGMTGKAHANP